MVLSMKPNIFKTIHPDAFMIPTNPGPAPDPVVIAAASTTTTHRRNQPGPTRSFSPDG